MTVSVAPLTTTVMNSVAETRAGIASGVNNAVSRTAGLLAVAVLGIVMVQSFNRALDLRLTALHLPADVSATLERERGKLAGAEVSDAAARQAIDQSFVEAFRRVMLVSSALALASAAMAWTLIDAEKKTTA